MLMELAETFIEKFTAQGHVLPLIQQAEVRVSIQCEQETIQIDIKNGTIKVSPNHEVQPQPPKNLISGDSSTIKSLFDGTERLRVLERKGHLTVRATLRTTLLLESLFFLTKAHGSFAKVI
jgi:hypothetical protein